MAGTIRVPRSTSEYPFIFRVNVIIFTLFALITVIGGRFAEATAVLSRDHKNNNNIPTRAYNDPQSGPNHYTGVAFSDVETETHIEIQFEDNIEDNDITWNPSWWWGPKKPKKPKKPEPTEPSPPPPAPAPAPPGHGSVLLERVLLGGKSGWDTTFYAIDDAIFGGKSHSEFIVADNIGVFAGELNPMFHKELEDYTFAAQHAVVDWELKLFHGMGMRFNSVDNRMFTMVLIVEVPPDSEFGTKVQTHRSLRHSTKTRYHSASELLVEDGSQEHMVNILRSRGSESKSRDALVDEYMQGINAMYNSIEEDDPLGEPRDTLRIGYTHDFEGSYYDKTILLNWSDFHAIDDVPHGDNVFDLGRIDPEVDPVQIVGVGLMIRGANNQKFKHGFKLAVNYISGLMYL